MKIEKGVVYYLTYQLVFPKDRDVWVKQEPFTGSLERFLARSSLPKEHKARLMIKGETSYVDGNGVWIVLKVETVQRPRKWGTHKAS